jgi:protein-S-isoprenylcysteine O-methyltransferase Ste14
MWYSLNPFAYAFSFTAAMLLFLGAGTVGYNLSTRDRFLTHTAWTDGPIWWEMGAGVVCALIAAVAWHRAMRTLNDGTLTRKSKTTP